MQKVRHENKISTWAYSVLETLICIDLLEKIYLCNSSLCNISLSSMIIFRHTADSQWRRRQSCNY